MWCENLAGQLERNKSHASCSDALGKSAKEKDRWQSVVRQINKPQDVSDSGAVRIDAALRGRCWKGVIHSCLPETSPWDCSSA